MCNHGKRVEAETKAKKSSGSRSSSRMNGNNRKMKLMKFQELPAYMKDNEYILDYYRCEWPLKDVFLSVFAWHNETLNIWTHLVGFLIFVGLAVMSFTDITELLGNFSRASVSGPSMMMMTVMKMKDLNVSHNDIHNAFPPPPARDSDLKHISGASSMFDANKEDGFDGIPRWPWFVFLSGAMGCLVCSSLSHLLACHSKRFNFFFWRLDYAGISLMIVSSFFAPIYYAFSCNPYSRFLYLSSISVLGILAIITLLSRSLSAPRFRSFRATLFLSMGFSGVIPAVHALVIHWGHHHIIVALGYELAMAILYASGAAFYVTRIPERWKPGKFDLAGHSHQIFHVFVVLGALAHAAATLVVMDFRRQSPTCAY